MIQLTLKILKRTRKIKALYSILQFQLEMRSTTNKLFNKYYNLIIFNKMDIYYLNSMRNSEIECCSFSKF